jgi:hypothetical protein
MSKPKVKRQPIQATHENRLSPDARQYYASQEWVENALPDLEEDDVDRAYSIWEAAGAMVNERYGHADSKSELLKLVNYLLRQRWG